MRELFNAAKARGINLSPAQLSESKAFKRVVAMSDRLSFGRAGRPVAEQSSQWNREVAKEIGADAPYVSPEVYAATKRQQSQQFTDLTGRNELQT